LPTRKDLTAIAAAARELEIRSKAHTGAMSLVPDEQLDVRGIRHTWAMLYGLVRWGHLFTPRQALAIAAFVAGVQRAASAMNDAGLDAEFSGAVTTCLALVPNRCADFWSSLTRWISAGQKIGQTFGRQAIPMMWDFAEGVPFADISAASCGVCTMRSTCWRQMRQRDSLVARPNGVSNRTSAS